MTEGKTKRGYWRRGPRKKKAAGEAAEAGASPQQTLEGGEPSGMPGPPEAAGAAEAGAVVPAPPAPGGGEALPGETPRDESAEGAGIPPAGGAHPRESGEGDAMKKPHRRPRRRGRKKPDTLSAESGPEAPPLPPGTEGTHEAGAPVGEAPAVPSGSMGPAPDMPVGEAGEAFLPPLPVDASMPAEIAPPGAETPAEPCAEAVPAAGAEAGAVPGEPGRKRRRRRRRRRGKGRGLTQGETGAAAVLVPGAEDAGAAEAGTIAAGGTEPEEPEPAPGAEEGGEEEESVPEDGTGTKKVMLIDGLHPEENRVAIVADGVLDYYEVENQRRKAFKGNIYKAKVVNIAHAIEAAFVEFGGGRHGFLPLNEYCAGALMEHLGTWNEGDKRPPLRPGMEILVQVTKEQSSIKGAAVTSYISIAGRYMVMMLGMKRYGISKKITGEKERDRIRKQMEKLEYPDHLGFIVRTVGASRPLKDLKADLTNLLKLWDRTVEAARTSKAPALLYEEQDIVIRTLRDNYSADVTEVLMNSEAAWRKAAAFFDVYYPKEKGKLKLYRNRRPLFGKYNLEEQVERATQRKVPLPSGGHIVIDRSEALWAIDVNSGRSSKDRDIEDTAYRTNREAAAEVTRQLRLRDIGGLIVIDFIDMESKSHNKEIERILKEGLKRDKAKSDVSALGKFGLVAISRQRMGTSFYDVLLKGCDVCGGTGVVPTQDSSTVRLLRRLHDELSREGREAGKEVSVRVAPGLLETLLNQKRDDINRLEGLCGGKALFRADPALPASSFSIENGAGK